MATLAADCVNYEINIQVCPCTSESCENRGICCECIQASVKAGAPTACMNDTQRDDAPSALNAQAEPKCATNQVRNIEFCTCTYDGCDRQGVCCNCVRNHMTMDGTGRTACMK